MSSDLGEADSYVKAGPSDVTACDQLLRHLVPRRLENELHFTFNQVNFEINDEIAELWRESLQAE